MTTRPSRGFYGLGLKYLSFTKSLQSRQSYPTSRMGTMALLRQTYLDAEWYSQNNIPVYNRSLEAWNELQDLPQVFEVNDKLDIQRVWKIGDEFEKDYIIIHANVI